MNVRQITSEINNSSADKGCYEDSSILLENPASKETPLISVVIPLFNEEHSIKSVIERIPDHHSFEIVVVDDGSVDQTCEIASQYGITFLKHPKNKGNGAATKTGLNYCKENNYKVVVIIDADGQHDPRFIRDFIKPIINNHVDFAIGNRFKYYYPWK